MGGDDGTGSLKNDVWYSSDGAAWTQAPSPPWGKRDGCFALVYQNKLWMLGGQGGVGGDLYNDVWTTLDGTTWTQVTAKAGWSGRFDFSAVVFDNKLWVFGGTTGPTKFSDVWYSSDGAKWTQAATSAGWGERSGMASVVYNNKLWITCGLAPDFVNNVWCSEQSQTGIENHYLRAVASSRIMEVVGPNPFRENVQIRFLASRTAPVSIGVLNGAGRVVAVVWAGDAATGEHTVTWDGLTSSGVPAPGGTYFIRCEAGGMTSTRTIIKNGRVSR